MLVVPEVVFLPLFFALPRFALAFFFEVGRVGDEGFNGAVDGVWDSDSYYQS